MPFHFWPLPPGAEENPFPHYRLLREIDPVHWSGALDAWVVTRYDDVAMLLRDCRLVASPPRSTAQLPLHCRNEMRTAVDFLHGTLHFTDGAEHMANRALARRALTGRSTQALVERTSERLEQAFERLSAQGEFDLVGDFTLPLTRTLCADALGIPLKDMSRLEPWMQELSGALGSEASRSSSRRAAEHGIRALSAYFLSPAAGCPLTGEHDWRSALASGQAGLPAGAATAASLSIQLLLGTYETIAGFLATALHALLANPSQLERLRATPVIAGAAVDELLRYAGGSHAQERLALADVTIGKATIRAGQRVLLMLAAANRDPDRFSEPDTLDLTRSNNHHLAFGAGSHRCLGASLAHAIGESVLPAFLARFPGLRLAARPPRWRLTLATWSVVSLPVSVSGGSFEQRRESSAAGA